MPRGIYKLTRSKYPPKDINGDDAPYGDVVLLNPEGTGLVILYAARNPHRELEDLGASLVASNWLSAKSNLSVAQRNAVFDAEWDDVDAGGDPIRMRGKRKKIPSGKTPTRQFAVPAAFHWREGDDEQAALDADE